MKHSYTSLSTFRKCPAMYKAKYIDKSVPFVSSPAAERGNAIHKALEDALRAREKTPPYWVAPELWSMLLDQKQLWVEEKMETDRFVIKLDIFAKLGNYTAISVDHKSGKYRPDYFQADVYYLVLNIAALVERLLFVFNYVDEQRVSPPYEPDKYAIERVLEIADQVESETDYKPKPDWYCGWCPVTSCRYNKGKK